MINENLVLLTKAAVLLGYSANALRLKIYRRQLKYGREYYKAPDGRLYIDIEKVNVWIRKGWRRG